jgi:hypothetical protein
VIRLEDAAFTFKFMRGRAGEPERNSLAMALWKGAWRFFWPDASIPVSASRWTRRVSR